MKTSLAYDFGYVEAAFDELEAYLLGKELFWPLNAPSPPGEPAFDQLTLGGLLFALVRIQPRAASPNDQARLKAVRIRLDVLHTKWRVAWEEKAAWELRSRLRQWGNYLEELQRDPAEQRAYYRYQVRWRVLIALLRAQVGEQAVSALQLLPRLDAVVRGRFVRGDFIWDVELQAGFPQHPYWYLWGEIASA